MEHRRALLRAPRASRSQVTVPCARLFLVTGLTDSLKKGTAVPFVMCSVYGCNRKLQPILKVDPADRATWVYRECDRCLRPACADHSTEVGGRIICDRCRRADDARRLPIPLLDPGTA